MLQIICVREGARDEGIGGFEIEAYGKDGVDYAGVFAATVKISTG